jgi:DNA-binding NtrC family response regulator
MKETEATVFIVRAMKAGAFEFLTKPFHDEDLLSAVDQAIERGREIERFNNRSTPKHSYPDDALGTANARTFLPCCRRRGGKSEVLTEPQSA